MAAAEFDYWDTVGCCRCQLPFSNNSGIGPVIPFWLTECGHVVCNNHLQSDQSCSQCGARDIQLVPLDHQMDAPMSQWFVAIPQTLDALAVAARFQQTSMSAQIHYYMTKHQKARGVIDRLRAENSELRKANEALQYQLQRNDGGFQPSDATNHNGKRRMVEQDQRSSGRPNTHSSPRSIVTPLGPNRLTLLPGQQPPQLSSNRSDHKDQYSHQHHTNPTPQRPGSSRFVDQYAYVPPPTQQFHQQPLSHSQSTPRQFQRMNPSQETSQRTTMLPPPPPNQHNGGRFKPSGRTNTNPKPTDADAGTSSNNVARPVPNKQMSAITQTPHGSSRRHSVLPSGSASTAARLLQPSSHNQSQRFVPPTPLGSQRFSSTSGNDTGHTSRVPSRMHAHGAGGQRMPFVPGSFG